MSFFLDRTQWELGRGFWRLWKEGIRQICVAFFVVLFFLTCVIKNCREATNLVTKDFSCLFLQTLIFQYSQIQKNCKSYPDLPNVNILPYLLFLYVYTQTHRCVCAC